MPAEILIKNMVCPRCIKSVRSIMDTLDIRFSDIQLGSVIICDEISSDKLQALSEALTAEGFELLDDMKASEVEKTRLAIIDWVRMDGPRPKISNHLQSELLKEYSSISKLFSSMKSVSVERYAVLQRIEYAKELISYGQMSISEIAWKLEFSSPAHFSSQFKKETGISPKQFMSMHGSTRRSIDEI